MDIRCVKVGHILLLDNKEAVVKRIKQVDWFYWVEVLVEGQIMTVYPESLMLAGVHVKGLEVPHWFND